MYNAKHKIISELDSISYALLVEIKNTYYFLYRLASKSVYIFKTSTQFSLIKNTEFSSVSTSLQFKV